MDTRRFLTGTIVGGVVLFVVGYLLFNVLLAGFYAANAGGATGVMRPSIIYWATVVGALGYGALITWVMMRGGGWTAADGFKAGAMVGFLMWLSVDFTFYGFADINNLLVTIFDPIVELVHGGIGGLAIAWVAGRGSSSGGNT